MNFKSFLAITLLPLVIACGKNSPLNTEQKQSLKETTDSAGRATKSARTADDKSSKQARMISSALFRSGQTAAAELPKATDETEMKMANSLKESKCTIEVKEPSGKSSLFEMSSSSGDSDEEDAPYPLQDESTRAAKAPTKQEFAIKVSGPTCPIDLTLNGSSEKSNTSKSVDVSMKFSVKDDSFRKLNDVDAGELAASMKGGDDSSSFNLQMDGNLHSQKNGDVKIQVTGSGKAQDDGGFNGEITATYEFPEFTAELKAKMEGKEKPKYTLNGEAITEKEFQEYLNNTAGQG